MSKTSREAFLKLHEACCADARELCSRKSGDYADDGDALRNLRMCEALGLATVEQGILVRLTDKLSRLANLMTRDAKVVDESVRDTVLDIVNYALLFLAADAERKSVDRYVYPVAPSAREHVAKLVQSVAASASNLREDYDKDHCGEYLGTTLYRVPNDGVKSKKGPKPCKS